MLYLNPNWRPSLRNIYTTGSRNLKNPKRAVTCPSTGEGEEPVVMVAGVKAERCRSCAEGTLSDGFWLAEEVGHASHPSLSDWLAVFEGQLETFAHMMHIRSDAG